MGERNQETIIEEEYDDSVPDWGEAEEAVTAPPVPQQQEQNEQHQQQQPQQPRSISVQIFILGYQNFGLTQLGAQSSTARALADSRHPPRGSIGEQLVGQALHEVEWEWGEFRIWNLWALHAKFAQFTQNLGRFRLLT